MSTPVVHCPTCKREVEWTPQSAWRPFCSERCKLIDLGAWFSDERSIADDSVQPEIEDDSPRD